MRQLAVIASSICIVLNSCSQDQATQIAHERVYSDVYESIYLDSVFSIDNAKILTVDLGYIIDSLRNREYVKRTTLTSRLIAEADFDIAGETTSCDIVNESIIAITSRKSGVVLYDRITSTVVRRFGVGQGPAEFLSASDIQFSGDKFAVMDLSAARISLFEDMQFIRSIPFKFSMVSSGGTLGIRSDGISIIDNIQYDHPSILFIPFDENEDTVTYPLQKWFTHESMSLYNNFFIRQSELYTVIASPGAPYAIVYDKEMNVSKIIQFKFFPTNKIDLNPRGQFNSGDGFTLAHQLFEIQISDNKLYVLTKYVDYLVSINLDGNEDDWSLIRLNRREEGQSSSEYEAIHGKRPPMNQFFDVLNGSIITCSIHDEEIDLLQINP